jgi:hypothetical protein
MVRLGFTIYRRLLAVRLLTLYLDLPQVSIVSSLKNLQELCENVPYSDLAINIVKRKADHARNQVVSRIRRFEIKLRWIFRNRMDPASRFRRVVRRDGEQSCAALELSQAACPRSLSSNGGTELGQNNQFNLNL